MVILSINKVLESGRGGISCRYEGAERLTPGGNGSGAVATANGSKGSSGAPVKALEVVVQVSYQLASHHNYCCYYCNCY